MQTDPRHTRLEAAIAAVELAQKTWDATAPGFHTVSRSSLSAVADIAAAAGADEAAAQAPRWFRDGGLSQRIFDELTEPVSDLIASTALDLRDALYERRGGSTTTPRVKRFWDLIPRVDEETGLVIMPAPFAYPPGLDEAQVLEVIQPLIDNLEGLVVAFDFDGTVAPMQEGESAKDTRADPLANLVLNALSMRARKVVMLTARYPFELLGPDRIQPTSGLLIIGNDGLSRWTQRDGVKTPTLTDADLERIETARHLIQPFLADGLRLEDKVISFEVLVPVGVSLEEADAILDHIAPRIETIAKGAGLTAVRNATYWSLRPDGPDKGTTLRSLREEFEASAMMFSGDSDNDGPAFEVVNEWRAEGYPAVGLLSPSSSTKDHLYPLATLVVPGPAGIMAVSRELARAPNSATLR